MALLTHPLSGASLGVPHFQRLEPGSREESGPWPKKVQFAPDFESYRVLRGAEPNGELAPAQRDMLVKLHAEHLNTINDYFDRECSRPGREWLKRPVGHAIRLVSIPHLNGDVKAIRINSVFLNQGEASEELKKNLAAASADEKQGLEAIYGDNKPKFDALPESERKRLTTILEVSHESFVKALENAGLVVRVSE